MTSAICILWEVSYLHYEIIGSLFHYIFLFWSRILFFCFHNLMFFFDPANDDLKSVTHLLAVDIASRSGMELLHQGLFYLVTIITFVKFSWLSFCLIICKVSEFSTICYRWKGLKVLELLFFLMRIKVLACLAFAL